MPEGFSPRDFYYLLPELVLTGGALLLLVLAAILPRRSDRWLSWFTLAVLAAAALALPAADGVNLTVARGLVAVDGFAFFFKMLFLLAAGLTVAMSSHYLTLEGVRPGEYYLVSCDLGYVHGRRHRSHTLFTAETLGLPRSKSWPVPPSK